MVPGGDLTERAVTSGVVIGMTTAQRPTLEAVAAARRRLPGHGLPGGQRLHHGRRAVRDAVQQAVAELGYVPNRAARSLVTQRTDSIALVVPEAANRVFSDDQFFPGIIRGRQPGAGGGRQAAGADAGRLAGRATTGSSGTPPAGTSTACSSPRCTAPTRCPARWPGSASRWCAAAGRLGRRAACRTSTSTTSAASPRPCEHLIDSGRRRIATIAGPQDMVAGIDRLTGYRADDGRRPGCPS